LSPGSAFFSFPAKNREGHVFTVGMGICYDMRFPELALVYARRRGCDLLIYPGAFNTTTGNLSLRLLSSSAICLLCVYVPPNTGRVVDALDQHGGQIRVRFTHKLSLVGSPIAIPPSPPLPFRFLANFPPIFTRFPTLPGPVHWELLARGRALDTQCYVAACSPAQDTSASYVSHAESLVVSPWGTVLANAGKDEGHFCVEVSRAELDRVRSNIPIRNQLRKDMYSLKEAH
uniref:omega-amidase n=1 Tax=Schistocephalus solidus TaxID=70667 RepID=A0A183TIH6_SCHSO